MVSSENTPPAVKKARSASRVARASSSQQFESLRDWREVGGVPVPAGHSVTVDGQERPASAVAWNKGALRLREPLEPEDSRR